MKLHGFPVGGETMARRTDPETSHEAAKEFKDSGHLGETQKTFMDAVRDYPGDTIREIVQERLGGDLWSMGTRASELKRKGWVYYGQKRPCRITGKPCVTLWPVIRG